MSNAQQQQRQKASARQRAEKQARGFGGEYLTMPNGCKLWQPEKAGTYKIRILPYIVGKGNPFADEGFLFYERTFWTYRAIGPNEDTVLALAKTFNIKDPIMEHVHKLQTDATTNKDTIKALRPRERQMFNILDLEHMNEGVQVFEISNFAFGELLDERVRSKPDKFENFWDAVDGMDLEVTFREESVGTGKFLKAVVIDFEKGKSYPEDKILEKTYCLDSLLVPMSYADLHRLYFQEDFDATRPAQSGGAHEEDKAPWETGEPTKKQETAPSQPQSTAPKQSDDDWLKGSASGGGNGADGWDVPQQPAKKEPEAPKEKKETAPAAAAKSDEDSWANW